MTKLRSKSLLRHDEYRRLSRVNLDGKVLDIGGSKKSGYHELIGGTREITTANIDPEYGTDLVFNAEEAWPLESKSYDAVLLINVLEHLYHYEHTLNEAHRVLVEGGRVVGVVPFMFNVHGSPNDYFRFTRQGLEQLLADHGFINIHIEELGTGMFSVVYQCLISFIPGPIVARPFMGLARALDGILDRVKPGSALSRTSMPLGYYFEATT